MVLKFLMLILMMVIFVVYANLFALLVVIAVRCLKENLDRRVERKIVIISSAALFVFFCILAFVDFLGMR